VLVTATGVAFTSDVGGNLYGFDTHSGQQLWTQATGSSIVAPLSAYSLDGTEYLAVVAGEAGNQQTPNLPSSHGSRVIAYRLGAAQTIDNDATGQVALANAVNGSGESAASVASSNGSAPYTSQQVAQGRDIYAQQCAACHGATLQGISAPALTGPAFGHSHLNGLQLRTVVTQRMPLTAPGSLKPQEYASLMAFLLNYDCVKPAGNGLQPLPAAALPALQQVQLGGTTCAAPVAALDRK
jgi:mono/diheme cytochrome c family protein